MINNMLLEVLDLYPEPTNPSRKLSPLPKDNSTKLVTDYGPIGTKILGTCLLNLNS